MINSMTPAERAKYDNVVAAAESLEAKLGYLAMMTDVDLEEDEDDVSED